MARLTATDAAGRVYTRFSETFTLKHNAVRAARRSLGAQAQPGSEFALEQTVDGWTWRASIEEPVKVERVAPLTPQPFPPSTVDELLRRIAAENGQIASRLVMQALHTAYAEGNVANGSKRHKRHGRRPLFLFNEPLTVSREIRRD